MLELFVTLSIAGLVVGPLLVALGRHRALPASALDGLTLGVVPAIVLTRHLPHAAEEIGVQAVGWAALGFAGLWLTERRGTGAGAVLGREVAFSALAVHALLDGAGLSLAAAVGEESADGLLFGLALLVHRLPEGLSLATRFLSAWGFRQLLARVALLGGLTLVGALSGRRFLEHLPHESVEVFIALGLGVLLRIVVHRHGAGPRSRGARAVSAVSFLAGLSVVLALPSPESFFATARPRELSIVESLGPLFVETAPSMLLGLLAAGLLHAWLPRHLIAWLQGGTALSQAVRGLVFGLPLPICACGVLPMIRRLLLAGAPAAAVVAFAIGTPELDVGGAMLSLRLLGVPLTVTRLLGSALLSVAVALLVARAVGQESSVARESPAGPAPAEPQAAAGETPPSPLARLQGAIREGVGPALDHLAAWYVVGLLLAAVFEAAVDPVAVSAVGAPADVVISALVAIPIYVCAQGATPLAAVMVHKGLSVGAALSFLMVGPATNIAVLAVLKRSLGVRAAAAFALGSTGCAVAVGLLANALVQRSTVPEVHHLVTHDHAALELLCAAVLGGLLLSSFVRLGPRAWFGNMATHDHEDDPAHGEAHDHGAHCHDEHCHDEHGHDGHGPETHEHAHGARDQRRAALERERGLGRAPVAARLNEP